MPFTQHVQTLLLMLREQIEMPLVYVEAIVAGEMERQLQAAKADAVRMMDVIIEE